MYAVPLASSISLPYYDPLGVGVGGHNDGPGDKSQSS